MNPAKQRRSSMAEVAERHLVRKTLDAALAVAGRLNRQVDTLDARVSFEDDSAQVVIRIWDRASTDIYDVRVFPGDNLAMIARQVSDTVRERRVTAGLAPGQITCIPRPWELDRPIR